MKHDTDRQTERERERDRERETGRRNDQSASDLGDENDAV